MKSHVSRMDFNRWNRIAHGESRTMKRISELAMNRLYRIEGIQKTITKYGEKITVNLEGKIFCYLPAKLSEALLSEEEVGLLEVQAELKIGPINLRRLEPIGRSNPVEFVPDIPDMADLDNVNNNAL